jgi:16S rRNA (cytosine967-C5)-methyltransferase
MPGYAEGRWWVQDAAAAFPARLLRPAAGARIADLCAAPGGKTAQLAAASAAVVAVDQSPSRLKRLHGNLRRLALRAELVTADILQWEPQAPFQAILLDAPCTATGTIRRHPDIAWLKQPQDVAALADLQARMLDRAWHWVAPGGLLVYCSCSLEPEEGEHQAQAFLARHREYAVEPVEPAEIGGLEQAITPEGYLRTLPHFAFGADDAMRGMDGFFAVRLRRKV